MTDREASVDYTANCDGAAEQSRAEAVPSQSALAHVTSERERPCELRADLGGGDGLTCVVSPPLRHLAAAAAAKLSPKHGGAQFESNRIGRESAWLRLRPTLYFFHFFFPSTKTRVAVGRAGLPTREATLRHSETRLMHTRALKVGKC